MKARVWAGYEDDYTPSASDYKNYQIFTNLQLRAERLLRIRGFAPPKDFDSDKLKVVWEDPPKKRRTN